MLALLYEARTYTAPKSHADSSRLPVL